MTTRFRLNSIARCAALICASSSALAQSEATLERVVVTGSSIKRVADEGALPLQVITRKDIDRAGITSAEQLMSTISAIGNGVDNMTSQQGGDFLNSTFGSARQANNGAAGASLRGLGPQYTLVLLNGRRLAPHGLTGSSVDLNSIPLAAVERVEILKDGASAVYGTDAIGGVINFILRKDYTGLEVGTVADVTQQGGGNIYRANVLFGKGSLEKDGVNFLTSLTFDKQERIRGTQRSFNNGNQPDRGLSPDTVGTPYANIIASPGTAIGASYALPQTGATLYNRANLLAFQGNCGSVPGQLAYNTTLWGAPNNGRACAYDYGSDWSLQQPVERQNLVSRGTLKINDDHSLTAEVIASHTKSTAQYTPIQFQHTYPVGGPFYQDLTGIVPGFDKTLPILYRWRCLECGDREQQTSTNVYRATLGAEGLVSGWDYRVGLSNAQSKASTQLVNGNMFTDKLYAAMDTGLINPWLPAGQSQSAQAMQLLDGAQAHTSLYGGKATLTELDGTISREIYQLPAGPLAIALGFDIRREAFQFKEDESAQPAILGVGAPPSLSEASRRVNAVFTELSVPIVKNLEAQVALRYDHYSDAGGTTNPKFALRYQPIQSLLFRGSVGTGFHAPDFGDLYAGQSEGQFSSDVADPVLCPQHPGDPLYCNIRPITHLGGNPDLKPEKSKQFSLGTVFSPIEGLNASIDFWQIQLKDKVAQLSPQQVLANSGTLGQYIVRDATGAIAYVQGGLLNVAQDKTRGIDFGLNARTKAFDGDLIFAFDGTYIDSYKVRQTQGSEWSERVGQFGDFTYGWDLKLRWKHQASVTWAKGVWSTTLIQQYRSGYHDEDLASLYGATLPVGFDPRVKSYTLYNLSTTFAGFKDSTITVGVKNLFNTNPSFSAHNVDDVAGAGWDARVGDPRGRAFTIRYNYKFL